MTISSDQRKIINRLKRARGQLDAVINTMENEKSCQEVVPLLSAVTAALNRAGYAVVLDAMKTCLMEPSNHEEDSPEGASEDSASQRKQLSVTELEQLFLSLT
ncbi:metal-sensitive transcriptional regulator [Corynebacterium alimapuense]|uniref:Transcriptional regulator n=1 Tax=Corynebacterium alimapuense TaxID=1576874 RepID=A0A3M8K937_9CORY|nr:metal-sensitive transcriptional regulator [Corynebacterium alimapuense]RNE49646.1 transcriptional regulator [Corynebacterium alimapuense]